MTQEQAKNLTFPCKVRVTKAGRNTYWYSGAIGGTFNVVGLADDNEYLIVVGDAIAIYISDCELYEESSIFKFKKGDKIIGLVGDAYHDAGEIGVVDEDNSKFPFIIWNNGKRFPEAEKRLRLYEEPKEVNPQPDEQPEKVNLSPDEIYQAWKDGKVVKWVGYTITDMYKFSGGKIVFEDTSNSISTGVCGLDNAKYFTIEEPVEAMFTPIYFIGNNCHCAEDYNTIEDAKQTFINYKTCILEHNKIGGKWVFVKAHKID